MVRRYERGNVAGFVIVGLALLGLIVASIYVVRHSMLPVAGTPSTEQVASPTGTTTDASKDKDTSGTADTTKDTTNDLKTALSGQAAEEQKAAEQRSAQQAESTGSTSSTSAQNSAASASPGTSASANLPTTGPEDAILPAVGVALLAAVGIAFVRSRSLI